MSTSAVAARWRALAGHFVSRIPVLVFAAVAMVVLALPSAALAEPAGGHCAGSRPAAQVSERLVDVEAMLKSKADALRKAEANAKTAEAKAEAAKLKREVEALQAEMAELVYVQACATVRPEHTAANPAEPPRPMRRGIGMPRGVEAPSPPPATGAPPSQSENVEMSVFFATSRSVDPAAQGAERFKATHGGKLQYGRALVSIPKSHKEGNLELPSVMRLEMVADPNKHFVLKSTTLLDSEPLRAEIRARLDKAERKAALVFVHGFNSSFTDAAFRTAQLAQDLKFKGVPLFFSWPSLGKVSGYPQDTESARLSEPLFEAFLEELYADGFEDIYLVAHSMGSRIASAGFSGRIAKGGDVSRIRALMLAAPDLNETFYREQIAPQFAKLSPLRATVYASSSDIALKASRYLNGYRRIGETEGGVGQYQGTEVIDSSGVSTIYRGFGHSYVVDSTEVMRDIASIIEAGKGATDRGLVKKGSDEKVYWAFK